MSWAIRFLQGDAPHTTTRMPPWGCESTEVRGPHRSSGLGVGVWGLRVFRGVFSGIRV